MFDVPPDPLSDCMEAYERLQKQSDALRERLHIARARIVILKRALALSSQCVADLLDQLDIENFGADTHYSCALAEAAVSVGLANKGDSAFDLDGITLEQARTLFREIEMVEG